MSTCQWHVPFVRVCFRVEDFPRDKAGMPWLYGCYLYTLVWLQAAPGGYDAVPRLPAGCDPGCELIEGVHQVALSTLEAVGLANVLSRRYVGEAAVSRQGRA